LRLLVFWSILWCGEFCLLVLSIMVCSGVYCVFIR